MGVDEWLVLGCTDRIQHWKNKRADKCLETIRREQSCWAQDEQPTPTTSVSAASLDQAGTAVHALSLLVQQQHHGGQPRSKVEVVGFARTIVAEYVVEKPEQHLLKGLARTHRDLVFPTEQSRTNAVQALIDSNTRTEMKFSAQELAVLLKHALDDGRVEDEFVETARAICARFSAQ